MVVYCVMDGEARSDLDHVVFASISKRDAEEFAKKNGFLNYFDRPMIEKLDVETELERDTGRQQTSTNKEAALDAFETADLIKGVLSGGSESPRKITEISESEESVRISYTYPRISGLSDCVYHDTRAGKAFVDEFRFDGSSVTLNGHEDVLGASDFLSDPNIFKVVEEFKNRHKDLCIYTKEEDLGIEI